MNPIAILFLVINAGALLALPRRWAPLPLLAGACYMTVAQGIAIAGFHFTVLRLLVLAGFIRVLSRGEKMQGGLNKLDWVMVAWSVWAIGNSAFHQFPGEVLVYRLGVVYNATGIYFIVRCLCQTVDDLVGLLKITALLLVPVALEMFYERFTAHNLFSVLGGVPEYVMVRDDKLRAQGPFAHAILAGTVGAACVPLMIGIWRRHPLSAKIGLGACLMMVVCSNSSGPLMSVIFSLFALVLWRWRHLTRHLRIGAVLLYLALDVVMKDPAYFLMARIDLTGSSTGYHRARLIQVAFQHTDTWWFAGTDYTRDWMPYGVSWSPNHVDITNQYLQNAVWGGMMLMVLFIWTVVLGFSFVGQSLRWRETAPVGEKFMIWCLGAGLFAHTASMVSVTYFDQSIVFLYLNLGAIGSLRNTAEAMAGLETTLAAESEAAVIEIDPGHGENLLPEAHA